MVDISGWGRYPIVPSHNFSPTSLEDVASGLRGFESLIPRGMGRSYGDSSLASHVVDMTGLNRFIAFNEELGMLTCDAGVSVAEILQAFIPRGWFLPVTPGTQFVTVGGAIASDVHGKNHHHAGTFSQHVTSISMILGNGDFVTTSPNERADLFYATCGGMGLTGVIVNATICLKRIKSSYIVETTIKAENLDAVLDAFEAYQAASYSVAWIDCLATGKALGRSLLMLGEHAEDGDFHMPKTKAVAVPFDMPTGLLNQTTVRSFNTIYYHRVMREQQTRQVGYESFFYPLDRLSNWNRLYGKQGFIQYQFVLPKESGYLAIRKILESIVASGRGSFLAVLKTLGPANLNLLSFPLEGYTLALDFKAEPVVFKLIERLDSLVLSYGGRIYLTKDARMSESTFKASYPDWALFEAVRSRYHAVGKFASEQSKRIGLL